LVVKVRGMVSVATPGIGMVPLSKANVQHQPPLTDACDALSLGVPTERSSFALPQGQRSDCMRLLVLMARCVKTLGLEFKDLSGKLLAGLPREPSE